MTLGLSVPLYDEEALVEAVVAEIIGALEAGDVPFRLALVDNGSRDRTGEIVDRLAADPRVMAVHVSPNRGYGGGILAGIAALQERGDCGVLGWCWGDGQVDPAVIPALYEACLAGADLAKARRTERRTGMDRRLVSAGYEVVTQALGVRTRDVNGCPKLLRAEAWEAVGAVHRDWFLDAEVVLEVEARRMRVAERPVVMRERAAGESKVRLGTVLEFVGNLARWRLGR